MHLCPMVAISDELLAINLSRRWRYHFTSQHPELDDGEDTTKTYDMIATAQV